MSGSNVTSKNSKIIFINSFKGGAGKTTLALTHCIDSLFNEKKEYENIVYMDLDILGTGTCYLFDEKKMPIEKCFNYTQKPVSIELQLQRQQYTLYVAYLNPRLKNHSAYGIDQFMYHQEVAAEILRNDVLNFIKLEIERASNSLFVLDCAPGFSEFEQKLLKDCYTLALDRKVGILEEYVTTLDEGHVRKCIQCLNDSCRSFSVSEKHRTMRLILNDVQNYAKHLNSKGIEVEQKWKDISKEIKKELINRSIELYIWRYSESIAMQSTFLDKVKIENQIDDYMFTRNNFYII